MREIKFRAWSTEHEKMTTLYGFSLNLNGEIYVPSGFVLMQYTGLKDKNGKEIYEGDILASTVNVGLVVWNEHKATYVVKWHESFTHPLRQHQGVTKIIGNIYENPELLES